jgi:hypothetical protein
MWPRSQMPDPMGGKRLLDYDCKVFMGKEEVVKPRKIRNSGDIRPGSKKGKLDKHGIWLVTIKMPKKLIADIYSGTQDIQQQIDGAGPIPAEQPADGAAMSAPMDAAGAMTPEVTPMEPAI